MLKPILLSITLAAALAAHSSRPLSGRVVDATGQGISGASVEVIPFSGTKLTTTTDASGAYGFDGLVPGRYQINVLGEGFDGAVLFAEIIAGETARVNTTLRNTGSVKRIRVGGNVQSANIVKKVAPVYPAEAKQAGISGTVMLHVIISPEGKLVQVASAESPDPALTKSAIDAVQQWEWRPTLLNGLPIEVATRIDVNYTLAK